MDAAVHSDVLLDVRHLSVSYGRIQAVRDVSFQVQHGELVALIGANGAGKTTILRTVSGLSQASGGEVLFQSRSILRASSRVLVKQGIVHIPEGRAILATMTVEENLLLGAYSRSDAATVAADLHGQYDRFPILAERRLLRAGTLSGGEQQMLAIARGLMARPRLLLLDEPSLGLAPFLVRQVFAIIADLKRQGVTVLLVEQNARKALSIADAAFVIERGRTVLSGSGSDLLNDPAVQRAYLGTGTTAPTE